METNATLTSLDLSYNSIGDELTTKIEIELKINSKIAEFKTKYKKQFIALRIQISRIAIHNTDIRDKSNVIIDRITEVIISKDALQKLKTISERKQQQHTAPLAADEDPNPEQPTPKIQKT